MMEHAALKNLKDFLLQYNKISESCFLHCVNHLSDRDLSQDECVCVDMCTKKHLSVNHKVMQVYMEIQPQIINKRIEDLNKQQKLGEEAQKGQLTESQGDLQTNNGERVNESKKLQTNQTDVRENELVPMT